MGEAGERGERSRAGRGRLLAAALLLSSLAAAASKSSKDELWDTHHTPRLRHSRHSESSIYNNFGYTTQNSISAIRTPTKPVFTNCSHYNPTLKEESPIGTYVFTVKAEDPDPLDFGGKVTYQFVSTSGEKQKFEIDPNTGSITTLVKFDRDEPSREKEAYISVRASDNGLPPLDAVCTIKVIIEDINDNQPTFERVSYSESVPKDLPVGNEVMRIFATDIDDGNNSIVHYSLPDEKEDTYFRVDTKSGVIYLNKPIDQGIGHKFIMTALVKDRGDPPQSSSIKLDIQVVESNKKSPSFIMEPSEPISLREDMSDYKLNIAVLKAQTNIPNDNELIFDLVKGKTEQTNKIRTFILVSDNDTAYIRLGGRLDYEKITDYTLTVRVQNKFDLAAETKVQINVEDVNDNIPMFIEMRSGSVMENEPPGTPVMQVKAIDADGTSANNQVTYKLADHTDEFSIDTITGNITTLVKFDREVKDNYNVKVIATDNSESVLVIGKHNEGQQSFRIEISDQNDNPPHFTRSTYVSDSIPENANNNALVMEVKALDNDTASMVKYSIVGGNIYDAFSIEENTGKIRIQNKLDYENITSYVLAVRAFDGIYDDTAQVNIHIDNVNDEPPVFTSNYSRVIEEELLLQECVVTVEAYDPDIANRSADQKIDYEIVKEDQKSLMTIDDKTGCLRLTKKLDRDPPHGFSTWQVLISAVDEGGGINGLRSTTEVFIDLTDINDNAPYLTNAQPVVWYENQKPGRIVNLTAHDNDDETKNNGGPFKFALDSSASSDIKSKFHIKAEMAEGGRQESYLMASVKFDREEIKEYFLPIAITDSGLPSMTGVSILHVIIGDRNDHKMQYGESSIMVYNYMTNGIFNELYMHQSWLYGGYNMAPDTEIGRVYVTDPDDWDIQDKTFEWQVFNEKISYFTVNEGTGMITMTSGTPSDEYTLKFTVTEKNVLNFPGSHQVNATVVVTIKEIPEVAVNKSGSIRFLNTTAEDFITKQHNGLSKKDILHQQLSLILNASMENVDVFTVYNKLSENGTFMDVRYSAHGSPYYEPEKMNSLTSTHIDELEELLGVRIYMISIDECMIENAHCNMTCTTKLHTSNTPLSIYTNRTSFVGVSATTQPNCSCDLEEQPLICFNGGTPFSDRCECPPGLAGPRCEQTAVGFHGDGWAMYPPAMVCENSRLSVTITPNTERGLVFYMGPLYYSPLLVVQDFMSLELKNGYPVLLVNYGTGTSRIEHSHIRVSDGQPHLVEIELKPFSIEMFIDRCKMSSCMNLAAPTGNNKLLNVNGPIHVGGASVNLQRLGLQYNWSHVPTSHGFAGCISNLTINDVTYNLGVPGYAKNVDPGCQLSMAKAVSFGIDTNFLVAILVCVAILLILLLAVVVHRRRSEGWAEKELDDIRENIINYEDEGGGEGDAGYDLHVLRQMYDPPEKERDMLHNNAPPMPVPDISGFLDDKKHVIDRDPDTNPFDDVRHYAYEGDGNTTGSLSSLASCTDEGDLKFNYLSSFGPRFRKLADMYGEAPSDEDEGPAPGEESWC